MTNVRELGPSFNLWTEEWINLERQNGEMETRSIAHALVHAHEYRAIYDPSPLAVVGIHRLLIAIMQAIVDPQNGSDIKRLWKQGYFPPHKIGDFGKAYGHRFDLFSRDEPFLQSADLPLRPGKGDKPKTVAYLFQDVPAGTEITHYRHGAEDTSWLCPPCAAKGMAMIPAFATSGGAGIKPSINGVPPIYIMAGGRSLFESLALSLIAPAYQPQAATTSTDKVWWQHSTVVEHSHELHNVGYLHSMTFPARRMRLHPEVINGQCTRCGRYSEWGVRTMIFEMGESRQDDAAAWFDPFAAYRITDDKPTPIRPQAGRALWREFAGLFLQDVKPASSGKKKQTWTLRPSVLEQMAALHIGEDVRAMPFRCVGLRTDMKAKIFEWLDAGFDVPPSLLREPSTALPVREAIEFATQCAGVITSTFKKHFGGSGKNSERHLALKSRMSDEYWSELADPFRQYVLEIGNAGDLTQLSTSWVDNVVTTARHVFAEASSATGDDAASLRQRVAAESECNFLLHRKKRDQLGGNAQ